MSERPASTTVTPCRCLTCGRPTQQGDLSHMHVLCLSTMMAAARHNVRLKRLRVHEGYHVLKGRN